MDKKGAAKVLARLKRIEGQVRGLQRLVEEDIPCSQILVQVAAVTAAVKKVGSIIIQNYLEECLEKEKKEAGKSKGERLEEFRQAISRYIDWA